LSTNPYIITPNYYLYRRIPYQTTKEEKEGNYKSYKIDPRNCRDFCMKARGWSKKLQ
jgi:hypothetical protein